jgi:hypothetical protein
VLSTYGRKFGVLETEFGQQAASLVNVIIRNILTFCQSVTKVSRGTYTTGARYFQPLFAWNVRRDISSNARQQDRDSTSLAPPSLGILIKFLLESIGHLEKGVELIKMMSEATQGMHELQMDELNEVRSPQIKSDGLEFSRNAFSSSA